MSETNPTIEEIEYLAGLSVVRSDGIDRTTPALAREVMRLRRALYDIECCRGRDAAVEMSHMIGVAANALNKCCPTPVQS